MPRTRILNAKQLIAQRELLLTLVAVLPAKEVGSDLYNYFIRDEKLFFCTGDVSRKRVPASLVMAVIRSLFRTTATPNRAMTLPFSI